MIIRNEHNKNIITKDYCEYHAKQHDLKSRLHLTPWLVNNFKNINLFIILKMSMN